MKAVQIAAMRLEICAKACEKTASYEASWMCILRKDVDSRSSLVTKLTPERQAEPQFARLCCVQLYATISDRSCSLDCFHIWRVPAESVLGTRYKAECGSR